MSITLHWEDGQFKFWSDCQPGHDFSGRCIGIGDTFEEARIDAINELRADIAELEARTCDVTTLAVRES